MKSSHAMLNSKKNVREQVVYVLFKQIDLAHLRQHNCFVALSCDAPESKEKLKGHKISEKFDTNEEFKRNLL